jgi:heptosyltransferase-2
MYFGSSMATAQTPEDPKSVLIVRLGAIGDVVMLLPAVHALHQRGARVDWVCGKVVAPLLALYPWINRIEVDERQLFHAGKAGQTRALLALWRVLAGRSYDLCAVMQYDRRYAALSRVVRAKRRFQLDKSRRETMLLEGRWHANEYARVLGVAPDEYHEPNVELLRPDEVPLTGPAEDMWRLQEENKEAPTERHGQYGRIALVPAGAKNVLREGALRRWPIANYVRLASELLASGHEVVLTGSSDDAWVRTEFGDLLQHAALRDCIGKTTLPELLALYDCCDAVVTHDTGSLHIAAIARARVLAIFGPTTMGTFLPRRAGVKGIWGGERLPCRPCYDGRDFAACPRNVCMEDTSVARVIAELETLLRS